MTVLADLYDDPVDPAGIDFMTKPAGGCQCCIFRKQRVSVCNRAVELALKAGMESCDVASVVYVLTQRDVRQLPLLDTQVIS